jgi:CheY-like chemotaxis protein
MAAAKPTVLCVDDDLNGLMIRALVLEKQGYEVLTANDGKQALQIFKDAQVDAVLMDYYMPMVDGAYVAKAMRHLKPQVPIVMISGATALPAGALQDTDGFVHKGVSPVDMTDMLAKVLRHPA